METSEIVIDPKVMLGKPVIKGTRITVEIILERLGAGETVEDILSNQIVASALFSKQNILM